MSDVRQRKAPASAPAPASACAARAGTPRYQRAARPPNRPTRQVHIAISLVILAFFVVYAQRKGLTKKGGPYVPDTIKGRHLPDWYAVCSREGRKIYTVPVERGLGPVECVVVGGKEVKDTGSLAHVRRMWGDEKTGPVNTAPAAVQKQGGLKIIYLPEGTTLTPGLTDSHAHPLEYGMFANLQLQGSATVQEAAQRVEDYVKKRGKIDEAEYITGMGWDQNHWPVKEFPTAAHLDTPTLKGVHIVLYRIDVHAVWVSPAVLNAIGFIPVEDIEGGLVVRDDSGNPTGVFIDNAIRRYVSPVVPNPSETQTREFLDVATRDALELGMVGLHAAGLQPEEIAFFHNEANQGRLGLRVYGMLLCKDRAKYCGDQIERIHGAGDGRFTLSSVKLFGDGALGSRGAALLEDYSDDPGNRGLLLTPEEEWAPVVKKYYDSGWQVNIHAIGDYANKVVIDAMEAAIGDDKDAGRARRLRIEHSQIMTQRDLRRAADLGIIASFQPTHATSDMNYAEARLGSERIKGAYAWRTYLNLGGRIALGSDFPVEHPAPLKGFYAAVSRCSEDGNSPHGPGGWYPEEKLTREEALRGFTADAAYASFSTNTGSLTSGFRFDAVLWDDDLMTVEQSEMLEVKVLATIMDGRIVYGKWKA